MGTAGKKVYARAGARLRQSSKNKEDRGAETESDRELSRL